MDERITVELHHGGSFIIVPSLSYVGGAMFEKILDIDTLCVPDFRGMVKEEMGYHNVSNLFYKFHDEDFKELSPLDSDKNIVEIQRKAFNGHRLQVYFEHRIETGYDDPLMIPLHLPASPQYDQVDQEGVVDLDNDEDDQDFRESDEEADSDDDLFNPNADTNVEEDEIRAWMGKQMKMNIEDFEADGEQLSEYEDSEELRSMSSEGEEDEPKRKRRYPDFNEKTDMDTADLRVGMKFTTHIVFKNALKLYCLRKGKDFKYKSNDKQRISAVCARHCGWKIWASVTEDGQAFQIKTFYNHHNCGRHNHISKVDYKWLARRYIELFRDTPTFTKGAFAEIVKRDHHIKITDSQAYRAKRLALEMIHGSDLEQYKMLWDYCAAIRKWNPGSTMKLQTEGHEFQRLYVCFDACRRGFLIGCRPLIGLDACFLKGGFPGQLLCAIGIDANNNMFPIAYAICESECKATWIWFLEQLLADIGPVEEHGWTFISDQQKGLMEVLRAYVSDVDHRICVRHLYANFNKEFKGKTLKDALWNCARAATVHEFNVNMEDLRKLDEQAYQWLQKRDPQLWSRHRFSPKVKSDMLLNNISECFNSFILKARDKPIITMLEIIRRLLMKRFLFKLEGMKKLQVSICPKIQKKLEFSKKYAMDCICHFGRGNKVEVDHCFHGKHVVDIDERTCTCRRWDLHGIPCGHACAAIFFHHQQPEDFVHQCYSRETFLATYEPMLHPMPGPQEWPKTQYDSISPPPFKKQPGRPKRMRRRGADEASNPNRVSKVGTVLKCGRCNAIGHNARTCKGAPDPSKAAYYAMKAQKATERRARKKAAKEAASRGKTMPSGESQPNGSKTKKKRRKQTGEHVGGSQPNPIMASGAQGATVGGSQPNPTMASGTQVIGGSLESVRRAMVRAASVRRPRNVVLPCFGQGNVVFSTINVMEHIRRGGVQQTSQGGGVQQG